MNRSGHFGGKSIIALVVMVQLLPVVAVLLNSVGDDWAGSILPKRYSLQWIEATLSNPRLIQAIWHSLIISGGTLIASAFVAVPAVLAGHFYFPFLDRCMAALVSCLTLYPGIVLALGLLNLYSGNYGIVLNGTPWVFDSGICPVRGIVLLSPDQEQPARHSGCRDLRGWPLSRRHRFQHRSCQIILPTLVPALIVGFVMNFTLAISEFVYANLLVGGLYPTLQIFLYVLREGSGHVSSVVIVVYFILVWLSTSVMVLALSRRRSA